MNACLGRIVLLVGCLTAARVSAQENDASQLAASAKKLLEANCYRCHGQDGANQGGLNYLMDRGRLAGTGLVVPGKPEKSRLYQRVEQGEMPADGVPLVDANRDLLRRWIEAGAPYFNPPKPRRAFLPPSHILTSIRKDLESGRARSRRFFRYFTLTHLYNAGLAEDELQSYRHGLSKLVNSLSWGKTIVIPKPVDPQKTVLRIDLRDYKWNDNEAWELILESNPYGVRYEGPDADFCYQASTTSMPHVRADWFVAAAATPPLYHDLLRIPATAAELEDRLVVNVAGNLNAGNASRAGFNQSGVSQNNRLIERHDSAFGAYWKSYDFAGSADHQNLFAHPLGPEGENAFTHDGGEIIFNLPNGMQAYMLVGALGQRIDKGPTNIVSDPGQADRAVVNGLSCMSCHSQGMIDKQDQIREHVKKHRNAFSGEEQTEIAELYPAPEAFAKLLKQDADRFAAAVKRTGAPLSKTEPIVALARRFEQPVDLLLAAAEAGVSDAEFSKALNASPELARALGNLTVSGGTVKRDTFVAVFPTLMESLAPGQYVGNVTVVDVPSGPTRTTRTTRRPAFTNSVGMPFARIPDGEFQMGSPATEPGRSDDETQHRVQITKPFFLGIHEVTQAQYEAVMGTNPSHFCSSGAGKEMLAGLDTKEFPVESVLWDDAAEFCRRLSELPKEKKAGRVYRLPTEAEWEYACRGNTTSAFHFGASLLADQATFDLTDLDRPTTVGSYPANAFGLYDMHGNVWEWC